MLLFIYLCATELDALSNADYIRLASVFLAAAVFITERTISSKGRKKQIRTDWFLKIIVTPNLGSIQKFYDAILKELESSVVLINDSSPTNVPLVKVEQMKKFKVHREKFISEFITVMRSFDKSMTVDLDEVLMRISDNYTNFIDMIPIQSSEQTRTHFRNEIINTKTELFSILFKPLDPKL